MYKIYFDNRFIALCSDLPETYNVSEEQKIYCIDAKKLHFVASDFISNCTFSQLYIICSDYNACIEELTGHFKNVTAAGGVVRNSAGNVLMILHRNIWDLPKGMLEQNETVRECAVREVREETGVRNLTAGKEICVTHHTYLSGGVPILKHTHWFEMVCNDEEAVTELVPQVEEEITKAAWLSGDSLKKAMENTYASIRDVLDIANGCR